MISISCFSQQELGTYFMGRNLYQASHLNPGFMPDKDIYSVSSLYFNFTHNGFALKHLLTPKEDGGGIRDDSLILNINNAIYHMKNKNNFLSFNFSYDLLGLKLGLGDYCFGISLRERVSMAFNYTKDFMDVMLNGNGPHIGQDADLSLDVKAMHFRELGFNFMSKEIPNQSETLSIGFRLKTLFGLGMAKTTTSEASLTTSDSFLYLTANADYLLDMSGFGNIQESPMSYALNMKNFGLGVDIGFSYVNSYSKFSFSGSLLDIGFIGWRDDVQNYSTKGTYTFTGLDLTNYLKGDTGVEFSSTAQEIVDTLSNTFALTESNNTFRSGLLPRHYFSVGYKILHKTKVSALLYGDFYKGYRPNFSVSVNQILSTFVVLGVNYSVKNRSFNNLGASLSFKTGPVQMYFMTDNFIGILFPYSLKTVNFRFGLNMMFSLVRNKLEPKFNPSMQW